MKKAVMVIPSNAVKAISGCGRVEIGARQVRLFKADGQLYGAVAKGKLSPRFAELGFFHMLDELLPAIYTHGKREPS